MDKLSDPLDQARLFESHLLAGLLGVIGLQLLNVQCHSNLHLLQHSWIASLLILGGFAVWLSKRIRRMDVEARIQLSVPWRSPWPWLVLGLMVIQIAVYPPTMHDSLAYRLPRIYLALQDGTLGEFHSPDDRMTTMPWGWESLAIPFAIFNQIDASRLLNVGAWMLIYHLAVRATRTAGATDGKARWFGLALATAPFFVLQAASTANDIFAAAMLFAAGSLMFSFRDRPGAVPVLASLLALVLASSAKPQFLTLGLPWIAWWLFAPGKPWRQVPWWGLALAAPFHLMVSPLPLLFSQYIESGSLAGMGESVGSPVSPAKMVLAGLVQFGSAQFQLPVVPGAAGISELLQRLPGMDWLGAGIPKFEPEVVTMFQIDKASFGLVHFALIVLACGVAFMRASKRGRPWIVLVILAMLLACSQIVMSTMGRSFAGYLVALFPVACLGGSLLVDHKWFRAGCGVAIAAGLITLILNPSAPLWPAGWLRDRAAAAGKTGLVATIDRYLSYQDRAQTGRGMLDQVPEGEDVGILIRPVTPILSLWQPDWRAHRIDYVDETAPAEFVRGDRDWLLVANNAVESDPEAFAAYAGLSGWEAVSQRSYLPNISQGPETWTLYHRVPAR